MDGTLHISSCQVRGGRGVSVLGGDVSERSLYLYSWAVEWLARCRFLAVRYSSCFSWYV
jgi:hypothetical protein